VSIGHPLSARHRPKTTQRPTDSMRRETDSKNKDKTRFAAKTTLSPSHRSNPSCSSYIVQQNDKQNGNKINVHILSLFFFCFFSMGGTAETANNAKVP